MSSLTYSRRLCQAGASKKEPEQPWPGVPPILSDAARNIDTFSDLEQAISRAISESGEVMDSASPALRSIRSRIRSLNAKVRDNLDSIIRSPQWSRLLQDPVVSIRNGRFVVPVRAEMRSQVPGIVHDQSASGATVFIEPMPVVELNNELRQAISQEKLRLTGFLQNCRQEWDMPVKG